MMIRLCQPSFSGAAAAKRLLQKSTSSSSKLVGGCAARSSRRAVSSTASVRAQEVTDRCNLNIVSSPFPPIETGPYPPLYEFVSSHWKMHGGYLDDKVAIIDGSTGLTRTFQDYYTTAGGLAAALKDDMNVHEDSTVAIYCPNHVDYLPAALAVSLTGGKLAPMNPLYTVQEVAVILEKSRSSVMIAHSSTLDVALQAAHNNDHVKHVIVITDSGEAVPEGTIDLDSLRNHDDAFHETIHAVHKITDRHPVLLPYSSGTTGMPKGVCLSHSNIVANLLQLNEIEGIPFPPDHKLISPLPFYHIYAFMISMLHSAWQGQTLITTSGRFDLEQYCQLVEQHQPQRTHLVPPILIGLAKSPVVDRYDMSSLHTVISAAAPLSAETERAVKERLGCDVKQGWGMSELSPLGTLNSDFNTVSGSVGPLVSSTHAKVVDETGKSLGPNQSGELLIKGPQVMMGYLNDPDKTVECLSPSGWLRTGDVSYYDENNFFFITDRLKELIKVRGYPVAPAELEGLLHTHDAVADVAVIQVPDEASGELPRAYVVLKDPAADNCTEQDIADWVKDRVAPYKRLDGGVVFTDVIPKSASGKILRRILRDQVQEEMKS